MNDAPAFGSCHPVLRHIAATERAVQAITRTAFRFTDRRNRATNLERTV